MYDASLIFRDKIVLGLGVGGKGDSLLLVPHLCAHIDTHTKSVNCWVHCGLWWGQNDMIPAPRTGPVVVGLQECRGCCGQQGGLYNNVL